MGGCQIFKLLLPNGYYRIGFRRVLWANSLWGIKNWCFYIAWTAKSLKDIILFSAFSLEKSAHSFKQNLHYYLNTLVQISMYLKLSLRDFCFKSWWLCFNQFEKDVFLENSWNFANNWAKSSVGHLGIIALYI